MCGDLREMMGCAFRLTRVRRRAIGSGMSEVAGVSYPRRSFWTMSGVTVLKTRGASCRFEHRAYDLSSRTVPAVMFVLT